jgi:hypothetical protein
MVALPHLVPSPWPQWRLWLLAVDRSAVSDILLLAAVPHSFPPLLASTKSDSLLLATVPHGVPAFGRTGLYDSAGESKTMLTQSIHS